MAVCANRLTHFKAVLISLRVGIVSLSFLLKSVVNFLMNQKLPGFEEPLMRLSSFVNPVSISASETLIYPSSHDVVEVILLKVDSATNGRPYKIEKL